VEEKTTHLMNQEAKRKRIGQDSTVSFKGTPPRIYIPLIRPHLLKSNQYFIIISHS
jgi:hypothetical protein